MVLERHKFTLEQFHQMSFFDEDSRVELMDGEIIYMSPIGRFHAACLKRLIRLLEGLDKRAVLSAQDPLIVLGSEPIPDITLLKYRDDFYANKAASAEDALLVIEVSDSTLEYDQKIKVPKYAKASIPEVWVIDVNENLIWVYRSPSHLGYQEVKTYRRDDTLTLLALPDITLAVNEILGIQL